jgi:hypothetical protein
MRINRAATTLSGQAVSEKMPLTQDPGLNQRPRTRRTASLLQIQTEKGIYRNPRTSSAASRTCRAGFPTASNSARDRMQFQSSSQLVERDRRNRHPRPVQRHEPPDQSVRPGRRRKTSTNGSMWSTSAPIWTSGGRTHLHRNLRPRRPWAVKDVGTEAIITFSAPFREHEAIEPWFRPQGGSTS